MRYYILAIQAHLWSILVRLKIARPLWRESELELSNIKAKELAKLFKEGENE